MLTHERYCPGSASKWTGRTDSRDNYDAFRWHQVIQSLDVREPIEKKDGLGFALIGFCCDEGIRRNLGRTGAANGPDAIRRELGNLPCTFTPETRLFDAGDISCPDGDLEASQSALAEAVRRIREAGLFPIVLGGGHELALGHFRGQRDYLKRSGTEGELGIANFDAHFDLRPVKEAGSSGTMFRQIAEDLEAAGEAFHYCCLGVQKTSNTIELFKTADRLGVTYLLAREIASQGIWPVVEKLDGFLKTSRHLYITVCADVFSSAFAPGVSAAQPLGIHPEDALQYIKHMLRTEKVVGFDIAEVSPRFDQDSTTASLAKVLIFAVVDTLSQMAGQSRQPE